MIRSYQLMIAAGLVAGGITVGCSSPVIEGSAIEPPTLDTVPAETYEPNLLISGTKTIRTVLWLHVYGQPNAVQIGDPDDNEEWSTYVTLRPGPNQLAVFSSDMPETQFSTKVTASVTLLEGSPCVQTPTLDATGPFSQVETRTLTGGKGAGTSVWIEVRGGDPEQVRAQGPETDWSYLLHLVDGANPFSLYAESTGCPGQQSTRVGGLITMDKTAPPVPNVTSAPESPTSESTASISGTREEGAGICVRVNQAPYCDDAVTAGTAGTDFDLSGIPLEPGLNQICVSAKDVAGNQSREVCFTVFQVGPPSIEILEPVGSASSAPVTVVLRVTGDGSEGSDVAEVMVCDGADCGGASTCYSPASTDGDTYTFSVPGSFVYGGSYEFCASAANQAGASTTVTISFVFGSVDVLTDGLAPGDSLNPALVWDASGRLHTVWDDGCIQFSVANCPVSVAQNNPQDLFHRRYDPATETWTSVLLVSNSGNEDDQSSGPALVFAGGLIHMVWMETGSIGGNSNGATDVAYRTIDPEDFTMSAVTLVYPGATAVHSVSSPPALAADPAGNLHLVWAVGMGAPEIHYSKYIVATSSWGAEVVLDPGAGGSRSPAIAVDSAAVAHVVWQDEADITDPRTGHVAGTDSDILYTTVTGGTTRGDIYVVSDNGLDGVLGGDSLAPAIALAPDGALHVVWRDDVGAAAQGTDLDIWYRFYPSGFPIEDPSAYDCVSSIATTTGEDAGASSDFPTLLLLADGRLVVGWAQGDGDAAEIVFRVRPAGGTAFGLLHQISDNEKVSQDPVFAASGSTLHAVWIDETSLGNDSKRPLVDPLYDDLDVFYQDLTVP